MYFDDCVGLRLTFSREETPVARKEHKCCECQGIINIGQKYTYFVGLWSDDWSVCKFDTHKTCLNCEEEWKTILEVFHENGEEEACQVFGFLGEAIQEALDEGFLEKQLMGAELEEEYEKQLMGVELEEEYEKQIAIGQMKMYSETFI